MKTVKNNDQRTTKRGRPALTPEARENQMISLAINLAEQQLRDGTASSQVISHYLKLGTTQARLEKEKLERENELLKARTEALASAKKVEELYDRAIKAMKSYSGNNSNDYDGDDDEFEY